MFRTLRLAILGGTLIFLLGVFAQVFTISSQMHDCIVDATSDFAPLTIEPIDQAIRYCYANTDAI